MIGEREYRAALRFYGDVVRVAEAIAIPDTEDLGRDLVWILLGIGSRESHWGTSRHLDIRGPGGRGDHGHGHGLMQIDDRWHGEYLATGLWDKPESNIAYGASVLVDGWRWLRRRSLVDPLLTRAAIAAYNAGPGKVYAVAVRAGDPDSVTTGGDYSRNVLERAAWYRDRIRRDFPTDRVYPLPPLPPETLVSEWPTV